MVKRLTRSGNSLALVLDKPLLDQLKIDASTDLEISTDGDVIVITPVRSKKRAGEIGAALRDLDSRYHGVFKRLAQ